jgi:FecR-like protein
MPIVTNAGEVMLKRILFISLLLVSLVGCGSSTSQAVEGTNNPAVTANTTSTPSSTLTALVNEIKGIVQARQPDQSDYAIADDGLTLQLQGQVKTGDEGRARLDLSTGTIVRVASISIFTLEENQPSNDNSLITKLKLEAGKVWVILRGGSLDIDTPSGLAGVRGSYMSVAIDPATNDVYITCLEGNCSVQNPSGTLNLTSGQTGRLLHLDTTTNTYPAPQLGTMTPLDFQDWRDNNPEVASIVQPVTATLTAIVPTPAAVTCTIVLSGAVSKTLPCTVQMGYSAANSQTGIRITSTSNTSLISGGVPEVLFVFTFNGDAQTGTYEWANSQQAASIFENQTDAWIADSQNAIGSSSITFTSLASAAAPGATDKIYDAHGSVTSTLIGQATATGTVQMTITF